MKKILFVALALIVGLASCVKDEKYPGINITGVTYLPTEVTNNDSVTVKAVITSFEAFTATLHYVVGDVTSTLDMIPTNEKDTYAAIIPAMPIGTNVTLYVKAKNNKTEAVSVGMNYTVGAVVFDYSVLHLNELNGDTKFIEIYNMGELDLPLEGMYLCKDGNEGLENAKWIADATVVAPAHGYVLLYSGDVQMDHPEQPENLFFDSGLSGKKTVRIALYMADGTERDVFERGLTGEWGQTITNVGEKSFARTPDGGDWKLAEATPNAANPAEGEDIPQE